MEPPASLDGCVYYEHGSEGSIVASSNGARLLLTDSIDVDRVYVVSTLPNFQVSTRTILDIHRNFVSMCLSAALPPY